MAAELAAHRRRSRLVGRQEELEQLHQAISKHRLVMLTGGPGEGKTRLALELGAQQQQATLPQSSAAGAAADDTAASFTASYFLDLSGEATVFAASGSWFVVDRPGGGCCPVWHREWRPLHPRGLCACIALMSHSSNSVVCSGGHW